MLVMSLVRLTSVKLQLLHVGRLVDDAREATSPGNRSDSG